MSFPYWPNANGAYQQLNYVSSTQALSIVPGGNTVYLNVAGGGSNLPANPSFSTITVFPGTNPISEVIVGGTPNNVVAVIAPSTLIAYTDLTLKDGAGNTTDLARTNLSHDYGVTMAYSQNNGADFKGSIAILSSIGGGVGGIVLDGGSAVTLTVKDSVQVNGNPVVTASSVALSNFAGSTAYVPGGNNAYPLSDNFAVVAGKSYRISGNLAFTNGEVASHTDLAVVGGGGGFPAYIASLQNADLIPANNGAAGGYSSVFLASANATCQVVAYNTATTTSTLVEAQSASAKWVLENLGSI